ncbi:hypothetical protein CFSAN002369_22283 [Clostridium botulinum CFSAN002369]|nr:hypothetical protein CFSAN002369_22283 [Clostridium botulinum CFSAN002369]
MKSITIFIIIAVDLDTLPLGRGLFFFSGCFLSFSRSTISLSIYIVDEVKQNNINVIILFLI